MPRPLSYPPSHVDSTVLGGASITLALKAPQVILVVSQLWGISVPLSKKRRLHPIGWSSNE